MLVKRRILKSLRGHAKDEGVHEFGLGLIEFA